MKFHFLIYILFLVILVIGKNNNILDGPYAIREYEDIKWLYIKNSLYLKKDSKKKKANFYLNQCKNEKEDEKIYFIINIFNNTKICLNEENNIIQNCDKENKEDISKWIIIERDDKPQGYIIQNKKTKKYIGFNSIEDNNLYKNELKVKSDKNNATIFQFYKIYEEIIPKETKLLKKEPIDLLIKYIDLKDPKLKRENIKQIKKDEDNDELQYSLRSILENMPWIRKIFILMPNEKVKFLKSQRKIKEKIIFVNDKDLIGFDSAAIYVFQFNLWKMKKFGMSENFILMDDDYFINAPLNKSDFFYEENNQIFPLMITNDYYLMDERKIRLEHKQNMLMLNENNTQSEEAFLFRQLSSLKFIHKIFENDKSIKRPFIEASFSHNAVPLKLSDIKEIYDIVIEKYKYYKETLYSINRNIYSLHFQTLILTYIINKYQRKVHGISCAYIDIYNYYLYESKYNDTKDKLFVINTSDREYEENLFELEKIFLNKKFFTPTKYELEKDENNYEDKDEYIQKNINKYRPHYLEKKKNKLKEKEKDKNKRNNPYYYLEYFLIIVLIFIILYFIIKRIRNKIMNYFGYTKIQNIEGNI